MLLSLGHSELHFWPCQAETRQTTVTSWKKVSNKIFYSIAIPSKAWNKVSE